MSLDLLITGKYPWFESTAPFPSINLQGRRCLWKFVWQGVRKVHRQACNDRNRDLEVEDSILQPGGFCKSSPVKTDQLYDQYRPFPMRTRWGVIPAAALPRLNLMTLPNTSDSRR